MDPTSMAATTVNKNCKNILYEAVSTLITALQSRVIKVIKCPRSLNLLHKQSHHNLSRSTTTLKSLVNP
jgi:hypothetical protein